MSLVVLKVDNEQRRRLFDGFYLLGKDAKKLYVFNSTTCHNVARQTKKEEGGRKTYSKRQNTYSYFLKPEEGLSVKVCKSYYLGTFDISQKFVYNVHKNINPQTGLPKADHRGKWSDEKCKVAEEQRRKVIEHITSFPTVDAHYCQAKTNKKYLEAGLNIQKMYDLYKGRCEKENNEPVKDSYYRKIFNTEFNIDSTFQRLTVVIFAKNTKLKKRKGFQFPQMRKQIMLNTKVRKLQ